jgi:hypothetical protein
VTAAAAAAVGAPKAPVPHPDVGDWWALYDYGLEEVSAWPQDYEHPYPGARCLQSSHFNCPGFSGRLFKAGGHCLTMDWMRSAAGPRLQASLPRCAVHQAIHYECNSPSIAL